MSESIFVGIQKSLRGRWRPAWNNNPNFAPLRHAFEASLNSVDGLLRKGGGLRSSNRYSQQGLMEEMRAIAQRDTVPVLAKTAKALETARTVLDAQRKSLALPKGDPSDVAGLMLRAEMRNYLRSLGSAQALQVLLQGKVDERLILAATEVPPEMVGLTQQMRDAVQKKIVGEKYSDQLAAMEELDEAITLTDSAWCMSMQRMRVEIGFPDSEDAKFDVWMGAASAKIEEAEKAINLRTVDPASSVVDEIRKELQVEYARILPELYGPGGKFAA